MVHCKMALLVKGTISFYLFNLFKKLGSFLSSIASDARDGHGWTWISQKQKLGGRAPPPPPSRRFGTEKHFYRCFLQYLWHRRLQSAYFLPSLRRRLRSTKKQERLTPEQLPTDVQSIKDTLDNAKIAKRFASANEQRKRTFWKIWAGAWCVWLSGRWAPPPSHVSNRSADSVMVCVCLIFSS